MSFYGFIEHSFLVLDNILLSGRTIVCLSMYLLKDILVASFKFWQLWIKLLYTSVIRVLCGHKFSSTFGRYQGVWFLDHTLSVFSFIRNHQSSKWLRHFALPPGTYENSHCSTFSSAFVFCSVFGHSSRYVVVPPWFLLCCCLVVSLCFNFHFPGDIWCGVSFHMLIWHLYIFFDKVSLKIFDPFFSWVVFLLLSSKGSLCILDNSPLSNVFLLSNIFS